MLNRRLLITRPASLIVVSCYILLLLTVTGCYSFGQATVFFNYTKLTRRTTLRVQKMSQNCKSTYSTATTRDANNNTLYHGGAAQSYGGRGYTPPNGNNGNYKQVTAKVLFGSVSSINDLKRQEKAEREVRRTH
ncbi:hypothetical protein K1T71_006971 [Dendrolimus kikuchii]|uniref:Uncharacterized protein n=1 Tax=Dendrolimus kikuchii TaxID=765133 RepID=A0ACC1D0P0_9NEOP|nr:hypothetical protein K1T71_006971 [Dendrolimus kikuchii]